MSVVDEFLKTKKQRDEDTERTPAGKESSVQSFINERKRIGQARTNEMVRQSHNISPEKGRNILKLQDETKLPPDVSSRN